MLSGENAIWLCRDPSLLVCCRSGGAGVPRHVSRAPRELLHLRAHLRKAFPSRKRSPQRAFPTHKFTGTVVTIKGAYPSCIDTGRGNQP